VKRREFKIETKKIENSQQKVVEALKTLKHEKT